MPLMLQKRLGVNSISEQLAEPSTSASKSGDSPDKIFVRPCCPHEWAKDVHFVFVILQVFVNVSP